MGKIFNSEWKQELGMNQVSNVTASAFFLSVSGTIFPLLSLPFLLLCPMPSHLLFQALFQLLSLSLWISSFDLGNRVGVPWHKLVAYAS